MKKYVYVRSFGCQMNERDSEEVLGMLTTQGYEIAEQPEAADVILLNTCSVRAHAEERAFGKMGELQQLKRQRPEMILGIIGCMAKLHQERIFKRLPHVDLVAGPAELYDLPYLLAEIEEKRQRLACSVQRAADRTQNPKQTLNAERYPLSARTLAVGRPFRPLDHKPQGEFRKPGVSAFVTIMEGCDKACTYCIVPTTRGQEISRPAEEIIREINALAASGYQEVTLLGQNVNSYGKRFPDGSGYRGPLGRLKLLEAAHAGEPPEIPSAVGIGKTARGTTDVPGLLDFPALLRMIDASTRAAGTGSPRSALRGRPDGGRFAVPIRIRFTTSHPFDAHERLFEAMRDCDSVCEWLHLPVQSGANRILRAMRRGYTAEAYLKKIEQVRRLVPEVSLSTDVIVGFPGETEEEFEATVRLMREVGYDHAYLFKYSPRPGTDAAAREDDVPRQAKEDRHQRLLALQQQIDLERHRRLEGRRVEILVEQRGRFDGQWFGRTRGNHGVIVESPISLIGQAVEVRVTRATAQTLFGRLHAGEGVTVDG
ncbi:MAG: radical SAM protein [Candidatus Omnitrophota bacterium]|nr:radical SAM protein [Candidatus Omnitrophota bacterium]